MSAQSIRNKPRTCEDIKMNEEAQRLLDDAYYAAIENWKYRVCEKQETANRTLLMFKKMSIVCGTGDYDTCSFDRHAVHVVFRNELNGRLSVSPERRYCCCVRRCPQLSQGSAAKTKTKTSYHGSAAKTKTS